MGTKKTFARNRVKRRVRGKIQGTSSCPRLSVFRSNKQIYAQIIDDLSGRTLASASSLSKDDTKNQPKLEQASSVGTMIAEQAKNAGITKAIFKNNACSPMGDLDLLVRSKDFRKAHEIILNDLDFTFKFRSEFEEEDLEEAFRGGGTEYYKIVDGHKVWLELQWRPIAGRWIQPHNEPNGDELMNGSIEVENSDVRILSPEDNLLQVALHTAKHSYVRAPGFRLHSDVDRIVRFQAIDWEKFEKKVCNLKIKTAVYFSLYFASQLIKTPIPDFVLSSLKPSWFREKMILHFINKAGIYNQNKKKFSKIGYIIFNLYLSSLFKK